MRLFSRTGWVNEGTKRKCNYYHCLSHTPKWPACGKGLCTRLHTYTHIYTLMKISRNKRIWTEITEMSSPKWALDVCTESMNNGIAETNKRVVSSAPMDKEALCVSRNERRRTRLVGYVCPLETELVLSPSAPPLPAPFYPNWQKHTHNSCFLWKLQRKSFWATHFI